MNFKVLIISHNCFCNKKNNGKTLEALFSQFPKGCIAQLFFHMSDMPDWNFCNNYYRITDRDVAASFMHDSIGSELRKPSECLGVVSHSSKTQYYHKLKSWFGDLGRDLIWTIGRWNSPHLKQWLNRFRPNIVFYVGGKAKFSADVALSISTSLHIPLVSYYTDDYLLSIQRDSIINKIEYRRVYKIISRIILGSSATYVIGDYMAQEYAKVFNRQFTPIMNSVSLKEQSIYPQHKNLTISYFGGLHLNRWKMIIRLSKLVPTNVHIDVYTSSNSINHQIEMEFKNNKINYRGSLSGEALNNAMANSDILLHVESDDEANRRFTKLAVSTKIPEYLISSRPILGYGPKEVASMRILSENGIGFVIGSDDEDSLVESQIRKICEDYNLRKDISEKGYIYACSKFNREKTSTKLLQELTEIVNKNN